jgi:hypothetical protein
MVISCTTKIFGVHTNNVANLLLHNAINIEYVNKLRPNCGLYYAISILYVNNTKIPNKY